MPKSDTSDPTATPDLFDTAVQHDADMSLPPAATDAMRVSAASPAASVEVRADVGRGLRLLHTADWQIGKPYNSFPAEDAVMLAEARFQVVERIAQQAQAARVDAVLVAGDVFDAQGLSDRTIHRLFHSLAAFTGPWFLLPGNHDAALTESIWSRAQRLGCVPDNVHLCLAPRVHRVDALRLAILPAPLTQRHTHHDLTEWFAQADTPSGWWRIGLAHGSVQGILADDIDSSNPIAPNRADQADLDYLALGDWHGTRRIDARTWYSGTPETDRFRANESGQVLLLTWPASTSTIDGAAQNPDGTDRTDRTERRPPPTVEVLSTTHYRWRTVAATLHVDSDLEKLQEDIATLQTQDVVQYKVEGVADLAGQRRLQQALDRAQGRARSVSADMRGLRLQPTPDDIAALRADGYLGEVIATLQDAQQDSDPQQAECAHDALILLAALLQPDPSAESGTDTRTGATGKAQ
ncbi:DNA repair exonuclease [Robbsia sp. KACC 23696]|uniref:metallophosphoesterase family protein n=1 Tax=Robbsia sp. KACC 23696 TaxID=3149231 RepID=UPI00325BFFCE